MTQAERNKRQTVAFLSEFEEAVGILRRVRVLAELGEIDAEVRARLLADIDRAADALGVRL